MQTLGHFIDGLPMTAGSRRTAPVHDPATGEVTHRVELAEASLVDAAIASGRRAASAWSRASLGRRSEVMLRLWHLIDARSEQIATLISAEQGKLLGDARGEVARALENVEFAAGIPQLLKGGYSEHVATDVDVHELKQPLGVVAGITPFNFPFMVPVWMAASAVACGNSFVLKPSEKVPSAALLLAELAVEAGLPNGVLSVVNGDAEAVERLLEHPGIDAVSFVGSTPVARRVYERAAASGKRVQALGGAKNHLVVLPDADLAAAADAAVSGAFGAAGERCMAVSVVVAVGDVADELVAQLDKRTRSLSVGPASDPGSEMGPLITREHRDRVAAYVASANAGAAEVVVDGTASTYSSGGFFLGPTLVDHVTTQMPVYTDEVFGPVLSVVRVDSLEQALAVIDDNPYGNGASVFTSSGAAARVFSSRVGAGMVGVNVPVPVPAAFYSFGGWKGSLFGDSHVYGPESIHFYTRTKVVTSRWVTNPAGLDLSFPRNR